MSTSTLSAPALSLMERYLHFQIGPAVCSIPYYNNKSRNVRVALRAFVGKGSPTEIHDEIETIMVKNRIPSDSLTDETLKKLMTDNYIGIDCSGFAYHILDAESIEQKKGTLKHNLSFIKCSGIMGKLACNLKPAENCDVSTLAHDSNSTVVPVSSVRAGDFISMTNSTEEAVRNHILLVYQVDYSGSVPCRLYYTHAVAYPEDGVYGTGIKQGTIEITFPDRLITDQRWIENSKEGDENRIFRRALKSFTELRRLRWF